MAKLTAQQVKDVAISEGADVVGIARVEAIAETYPLRKPQDFLAEAKTVIMAGVRMFQGSINSPLDRIGNAHYIGAYSEALHLQYIIGRVLEQSGYLAATPSLFLPLEMSRETSGLVGDMSFRHTAVAAGLGKLGRNGLVVTPEFGPRIRLTAVVTDAPLEADKPLDWEPPCAQCRACIEACPAGALSLEKSVDTRKCIRQVAKYGLGTAMAYFSNLVTKPPEEQRRLIQDPMFWNIYQGLATGINAHCHQCIAACPVGRPGTSSTKP